MVILRLLQFLLVDRAAIAEQLPTEGFEAEYREFAETSHEELVDPKMKPEVVDAIFEVVSTP